MTNSNKSKRIINCIIDIGIIGIVFAIINLFTAQFIYPGLLFAIVYLFYYTLMEGFTGQTLGKRITKTKVVDHNGLKPKPGWIIIRTILRWNPFDLISYLFGNLLGTHDLLSRTKVVDE